MVAQRIVQLDQMSFGRAMLGTGPGALPSDAHTLGIDRCCCGTAKTRRSRSSSACSQAGERFTYECDWFSLYDAKLQILPYQHKIPMVTASMISPSA